MAINFEDFRQLKQDYGITSEAAFEYLKTRQEISDLCDQMKEYTPSIREAALIVEAAPWLVADLIGTLVCTGTFLSVLPFPKLERGARFLNDILRETNEKIFDIDYASLLQTYCGKAKGKSIPHALLETFSPTEIPYIYNEKSVTLPELIGHLEPTHFMVGVPEFIDRAFEVVSREVQNIANCIQHGASPGYEFRCLYGPHNSLDSCDSNLLYWRALRERTLGRIETERKIATLLLLTDWNDGIRNDDHLAFDDIFERKVTNIRQSLRKIIRRGDDERFYNYERYCLRALTQNRRYLENFFR